jgi:hypothetical protein
VKYDFSPLLKTRKREQTLSVPVSSLNLSLSSPKLTQKPVTSLFSRSQSRFARNFFDSFMQLDLEKLKNV